MAGMDRPEVDVVVEKPGEGVKLLVKTANAPDPSPEWAAEFLRYLYEYFDIPATEYFLLAQRRHLYLWRHPSPEAGNPDFDGDTAAALKPYLDRIGRSVDSLSSVSFDILINDWLFNLVDGLVPDLEGLEWVKESDLDEAVRDASIRVNVAA